MYRSLRLEPADLCLQARLQPGITIRYYDKAQNYHHASMIAIIVSSSCMFIS